MLPVSRSGSGRREGVGGCRRCDGRGNGRAVVLNWSATVGDGRRCQVLPVSRQRSAVVLIGRRCQAVAVRIGWRWLAVPMVGGCECCRCRGRDRLAMVGRLSWIGRQRSAVRIGWRWSGGCPGLVGNGRRFGSVGDGRRCQVLPVSRSGSGRREGVGRLSGVAMVAATVGGSDGRRCQVLPVSRLWIGTA